MKTSYNVKDPEVFVKIKKEEASAENAIDTTIKEADLADKEIFIDDLINFTGFEENEIGNNILVNKYKKSQKVKNNQVSKAFTSDPVKMYLSSISKVRLLTAAEEIQIVKKIEKKIQLLKAGL